MTRDITPWIKAVVGGGIGIASDWVWSKSKWTEWEAKMEQDQNPIAALHHGDVGLACWIASQYAPKGLFPYLAGMGASLVLMEFRQADPWGVSSQMAKLAMIIHLGLAGTILIGLAA